MRKIYPLPFNKFAGFLLYGLLSIAVITLAQDPTLNCGLSPVTSKQKLVTIGYVQPSNQVSDIPWESYDYINVVAYPNVNSPWNSIRRPPEGQEQMLKPIDDLVTARNNAKVNAKVNTKILLSIRNYDPRQWNFIEDFKIIVTETIQTLNSNQLDGVDIEYPGMRGLHCHNDNGPAFIWNRQADFVNFIKELRAEMNKLDGKKLMLTVGPDIIDVVDLIDYLNIETYHDSLYENLKIGKAKTKDIRSFPNSPLNKFQDAYNAWVGAYPKVNSKIIMGVDFGNTFQVVDNKDIVNTPSVDSDVIEFQPQAQKQLDFPSPLNNIKQINGLCPIEKDNELNLYSWPWKDLSTSVIDRTTCLTSSPDWNYKFDDQSNTPWLQRKAPDNPEFYHFVSYEDFKSLSNKLKFATSNSIGGMSISDVSYDSVGESSLLNFMQAIRFPTSSPPIPNNPGGSSPKGKEGETNPQNSNNSNDLPPGSKSPKTSAIIGGVFGSLIGLVILGACGFYFYRYRGRPKSASFRSLLKFKGFPNSGNHVISRNPEMTTEPTPNLFAPPTTVIPVASGYVTAMFDFTGKEENDLSFKKGDKIEVLERGDGPNDWWVGRVNGAVGEFPGNYVKET